MTSCGGLLISAPSSGCGKTLVSLALIRLLARRGLRPRPAKSGPDYIDPAFHAVAAGCASVNLDAHAMRPALIRDLAAGEGGMLVVEGAMGLFDGAADGTGSSAELAAMLGLPVLLVIDCARQAQSVAALVSGFARFRTDIAIGGLILNRVASARHAAMLASALAPLEIPVLAVLPAMDALQLPSRHLGLVQASEHDGIDAFAERAADWLEARLDLPGLCAMAAAARRPTRGPVAALPLMPLGQRIAVAADTAFAFAYPHMLEGWRRAGAQILPFSPLADAAPDASADAVYLPGGYPELHAGRLAASARFAAGMHAAAARGACIYGECGGYMTLGRGLVDAAGDRHAMLGLLPLETSFAERRRHLGYRRAMPLGAALPWRRPLSAHEFHYATILSEGRGEGAAPLFQAVDATGQALGPAGLQHGRVAGSFLHVIDEAPHG